MTFDADSLTGLIINCAYTVSNELGAGFLEKVYENALKYELELKGLEVKQQQPIKVCYKNVIVGDYFADLVVNDSVIVELKTVQKLTDIQVIQCLNYLNAIKIPTCLLLNFGTPKVEIRRLEKPIHKTI